MKVLFVLPRMVSGGVERVTLNLIAQFVHEGIECRLALRRCYGELLEEARTLVHVDEFSPHGLHQFVPALSKLIYQWQPTHIITAFADGAALTWVAMRLARSGAHWIHGVHNTHATAIVRPGWRGRVRYRVDNRIAKFVYHRADAIVAVSEGVRAEIVGQFRIDPSRVATIYNSVVPETLLRVAPAARHSVDQPFSIVTIGRLARQKGFDVLIKAMARVPLPWRLDIWGEGPERAQLERLISESGLEPTICLRGFTPNPFMELRKADLFVLPSRHEGLPTTLIEALACQCQVIATDCPHGPREILQNGRLGQLVPVDDAAALAAGVKRVLMKEFIVAPELMRERARAFSHLVACDKWKNLLQSLA